MVIVDACHLTSKYGGIAMSACAHDGANQIVPLAIGIADVENEDNWVYFLNNLRSAIPSLATAGMVFMHDRQKGLQNARMSIFPQSHESICVFHLEKNVNSRFKSVFQKKLWVAAKATTQTGFETCLEEIGEMNSEAADYLRKKSEPKKWARYLFPVARFGCLTSNAAESLNSWIKPLRDRSHLALLVGWIRYIVGLFLRRKEIYQAVETDVPENIQQQLKEKIEKGKRLNALRYGEGIFEFVSGNGRISHVVNLDNRSCSCGEYMEYQFPCIHVAAVIRDMPLEQQYSFIHPSYLTESLRSVYGASTTPVALDRLTSDGHTIPPKIKRRAGRPSKTRKRSRGEKDEEKRKACGICGQKGHNKRTCKSEPQADKPNECKKRKI
jgi:hypothetical protein